MFEGLLTKSFDRSANLMRARTDMHNVSEVRCTKDSHNLPGDIAVSLACCGACTFKIGDPCMRSSSLQSKGSRHVSTCLEMACPEVLPSDPVKVIWKDSKVCMNRRRSSAIAVDDRIH
jgi:hypothetical protein